MDVTLNWLKTYIDFEFSPSELADRLTMLGIEVESIKQLGAELKGVVVGSVGSIKPHPNADKLVLCQVNVGGEGRTSDCLRRAECPRRYARTRCHNWCNTAHRFDNQTRQTARRNFSWHALL